MCRFAGKTATSVAMLHQLASRRVRGVHHAQAARNLCHAAHGDQLAVRGQVVGHDRLVRARDHEVHDPGEHEERAEQPGQH